MKYIRTKDGIYELEKLFGTEYIETDGGGTKATYKKLKDISIDYDMYFGCRTKQADTIEELCDEFVIEDNGHCISDLYTIKRLLVKNKLTIYGAIWVDRGLIYVAKMNEDGVLCLLG